MGLLDLLSPQTPTVQSIFPEAAVSEIKSGRLPIINTYKIFLLRGETCHYIDKALYEKKVVKKRYIRQSRGASRSGIFFKNVRYSHGTGTTDVVDNIQYETYRGIIYITNRRIIFQGAECGFNINVNDLVAIQPYRNCVELQCSKESYKIFVPDGNVAHAVLQLIR